MNYQILLESYSSGESISEDELALLELELETQIENITFSRSQGCTEEAPKNICEAAQVCEGSNWITCLASILDKSYPTSIGTKARGAKVIDVLIENNYLVI
tara:strand:+ start:540 stop:842 length:303 start_codon:yes stop_codon:yes gene_type:complete